MCSTHIICSLTPTSRSSPAGSTKGTRVQFLFYTFLSPDIVECLPSCEAECRLDYCDQTNAFSTSKLQQWDDLLALVLALAEEPRDKIIWHIPTGEWAVGEMSLFDVKTDFLEQQAIGDVNWKRRREKNKEVLITVHNPLTWKRKLLWTHGHSNSGNYSIELRMGSQLSRKCWKIQSMIKKSHFLNSILICKNNYLIRWHQIYVIKILSRIHETMAILTPIAIFIIVSNKHFPIYKYMSPNTRVNPAGVPPRRHHPALFHPGWRHKVGAQQAFLCALVCVRRPPQDVAYTRV